MNIVFELSKEHKTFPKSEIMSCLKSENITYAVSDLNEDAMVIDAKMSDDEIRMLASRLSMTFFIDKMLFSCSAKNTAIKRNAKLHPLETYGSVAIRCKSRSKAINSKEIINELGSIYAKDRKVNLNNPDNEIRVLVSNKKVYVGLKKAEINRTQFEKRKVQYRPFFSPISLHPKIARALVNLSEIRRNETLVDPFCGTGGILIEAGLLGAKILGSDIEEKMVEGCKKTLDFYNIKNYELYCCDIGDVKNYIGATDAVVTDLPYGKSTTTKGEDLKKLYERAFENISLILKKKKKAVVGLSNKEMIPLGEKYLSLVERHEHRVHRSLTRHFVVYEN